MIWDVVDHFNEREAWGDPEKMNGLLILLIDKIADILGCGVIIHCGYEGDGHTPSSQHYTGNAIDFHLKTDLPFKDQIDNVMLALDELQVSDRVGVGLYPDWNSPGFHLDVRGVKARWGRIGEYVSFEKAYEHAKNC